MEKNEPTAYFAGFDWAKNHHDIAVIDSTGKSLTEFRFTHTLDGWQSCKDRLRPFGQVRIAMESGHIDAVERLSQMVHHVYVVNPKRSKAYRLRISTSGAKADRGDALALAHALRFEGDRWTQWTEPVPLVQELRILCRDEITLIKKRTALTNQLIQTLYQYYPAALYAFDDWTAPSAQAFVAQFPTPAVLQKAGKAKWEAFLHAHRCYHECNYEKRLAIFAGAQEFVGSDVIVKVKSAFAISLVRMLRLIEKRLKFYHERISACFELHPDHTIFLSLPAVGEKLAPRLLAEILSAPHCLAEPAWLQAQAGMAPVSYKSGQASVVRLRRQCNRFLQNSVYLWADMTRRQSAWACAYYQAHREKGHQHGSAVRCLGMRWLKIVCAMVRTKTHYDEALHARNQLIHGSWIAHRVAERTEIYQQSSDQSKAPS